MNDQAITVETTVKAPKDKVWQYWTEPAHITQWAFASDDWEAPSAENDLREGGRFKTRLSAKDKSAGFDFEGVYTAIKEGELIEYTMGDGRKVRVEFQEVPEGIKVVETFDPESTNSRELQQSGWQGFLNNFKKHVESQ